MLLGPCALVGVQVNTPVAGSIAAPAGAPGARLHVKLCRGRSGSDTEILNVRRLPSLTVWLLIGAKTGAELVSVTVTEKV